MNMLRVTMGVVIVSMTTTAVATTRHVNGTCGNDLWTGLSDICAAPDGPMATIQEAIDESALFSIDEIIVAPGATLRRSTSGASRSTCTARAGRS